jgi:hypothetical protein
VTELIANCLEGLLGATGDGIGGKRSGGVTGGLQVTELVANRLGVLLEATGDGIDNKLSGVVTGGYRRRN